MERKNAAERRDEVNRIRTAQTRTLRDITDRVDMSQIDWDRRLRGKQDLCQFATTYLPSIFYLPWSRDQTRCAQRIMDVFLRGGAYALAMPRGGGKTALTRCGVIWGTAYGHRSFPFLLGSSAAKAAQTLSALKTYWYSSVELRQDFPEIAWPIYLLENRQHLARGQLYRDMPTHIEWGTSSIRYPCLLLDTDAAKQYLDRDPESVAWIESRESFLPKSAGTIVRIAGVDGSIRGEAESHPILLTQPRPDVVILDDVQKDQDASSPAVVDKLEKIVLGAIGGLAGPDKQMALMMPCTVTVEGDLSDRFLDPEKHPEFSGERCPMVLSWPEGITDTSIGNDTEAARRWTEYGELRRQSFRLHKDGRLSTEYYRMYREAMDRGFVVSWEARFDGSIAISAQQRAMDLRLADPVTFLAEYQQIGRRTKAAVSAVMSAEQLRAKQADYRRMEIGAEHHYLVAFVDVQDEILFWSTLAVSQNFSGIIPAYGTFPEVSVVHKYQTAQWSLLTKEFFKAYPGQQSKAIVTASGLIRAPLEAKIYHALTLATDYLLSLRFARRGMEAPAKISHIAIDAKFGKAADAIKRFCRETTHQEVLCYMGHPFPPTNKQLEEYIRTGEYASWVFENTRHPSARDCKWVYRPDRAGMYSFLADVNRLKTFLFNRLSSPPGSPGSISMYSAPAEEHALWSRHICDSEYPTEVSARGITKEMWMVRDGRPDNDWLDCAAGCCAVASYAGACLRPEVGEAGEPDQHIQRPASAKRFRDQWQAKRRR